MRWNHAQTDWLHLPVAHWNHNRNYRRLSYVVKEMTVVNDPAERMVKLATERITTVRSELRFQQVLLTVGELQRLSMAFKRGTFTKQQVEDVVKKLLAV